MEIHPRVKDLHRPRLGKPRRGLQIFDTRVDFPVPVQSRGRFLYSPSRRLNPDNVYETILPVWS